MTDDTEYTLDGLNLYNQIGDIFDKQENGAILKAVSMVLADVVSDLEMEEAVPILLEVLQDAVALAYDVETDVVSLGKMQ
jgi:hypothetical protein